MTEEKNQIEKNQTKVELQVIADNREKDSNDFRKIILAITCDGSKLTKADAGYHAESTQEIWTSVKLTKAEVDREPDMIFDVHEKCVTKLTKADAGLA